MQGPPKFLVFDIQKFSYHDGPGIRTTVFLKGCNMRCFWCQNPESLSVFPELMYFQKRCVGCRTCLSACPQHALSESEGALQIDRSTCISCGACSGQCPTGALELSGRYMKIGEILDVVEEDREFYDISGGGLTLSGGEALLQNDISLLLQRARERNLHTVVQTAGNIPADILIGAAAHINLFLYDIKTLDSEMHIRCCGQPNTRILENLRLLRLHGAAIQVRVPVIPGVNDSEDAIRQIAAFTKQLKLHRPQLLPFNKIGAFKYHALGMDYAASELIPLESREMDRLRSVVDDIYDRNTAR